MTDPQAPQPPNYGTTAPVTQPPYPTAPPVGHTTNNMPSHPNPATPETGNPGQPQQGQYEAPPAYPQEPPPAYEPPKDPSVLGGYPPAGYNQQGPYPQQGTYPPQGYQTYTYQTPAPQPIVYASAGFGPTAKCMECPNCHSAITTTITYESGGLTWLSAGLLCLFGCWFGCQCIPFCVDGSKDVIHSCPHCNKVLGVYRRL